MRKTFFDASFLSWVCLYSCGWRYNRRGARASALDVPPLCSHLLADAGVGDCEFVPALCSFDALHDRGHETKGTLYLRREQGHEGIIIAGAQPGRGCMRAAMCN